MGEGEIQFKNRFLFIFLQLTKINIFGSIKQEGEKPSQIVSAELEIGYQIREDASNGDTDVVINNRRITKPELWMLQVSP